MFLVFLYQVSGLSLKYVGRKLTTSPQRWIYRIDPKRVNEYGQVGEAAESAEALEDKKKQ